MKLVNSTKKKQTRVMIIIGVISVLSILAGYVGTYLSNQTKTDPDNSEASELEGNMCQWCGTSCISKNAQTFVRCSAVPAPPNMTCEWRGDGCLAVPTGEPDITELSQIGLPSTATGNVVGYGISTEITNPVNTHETIWLDDNGIQTGYDAVSSYPSDKLKKWNVKTETFASLGFAYQGKIFEFMEETFRNIPTLGALNKAYMIRAVDGKEYSASKYLLRYIPDVTTQSGDSNSWVKSIGGASDYYHDTTLSTPYDLSNVGVGNPDNYKAYTGVNFYKQQVKANDGTLIGNGLFESEIWVSNEKYLRRTPISPTTGMPDWGKSSPFKKVATQTSLGFPAGTIQAAARFVIYDNNLGLNKKGVLVEEVWIANKKYIREVALSSSYMPCEGDCVSGSNDSDTDLDAIAYYMDNCPTTPNFDQADSDGDKIGDACEIDSDNDGICDPGKTGAACTGSDNCPNTANANQSDIDKDTNGDACDLDDDGDGVVDTTDNCPVKINADQLDTDKDGLGDVCDPNPTVFDGDSDKDGIDDKNDNCPSVKNKDQENNDKDTKGDACDPDDDNDGICDKDEKDASCTGSDNCKNIANMNQVDTDKDGKGDACDSDSDGDGTGDPDPSKISKPTGLQYQCVVDGAGNISTGSKVIFSWSQISGVKWYLLRLNKEGAFDPSVGTNGDKFYIVEQNSQMIDGLTANSQYVEWSVQPLVNKGDTESTAHLVTSGGGFLCQTTNQGVVVQDIPVVNPVWDHTYAKAVNLSGQKQPGTGIMVNGVSLVPANQAPAWVATSDLNLGTNFLSVIATSGAQQSVPVVVTVHRHGVGDLDCDGNVNIYDFSAFVKGFNMDRKVEMPIITYDNNISYLNGNDMWRGDKGPAVISTMKSPVQRMSDLNMDGKTNLYDFVDPYFKTIYIDRQNKPYGYICTDVLR